MTNNASQMLAALNTARIGWMTCQLQPVEPPEFAQMDLSEVHLRLLAMDAQLRCLTAASPPPEALPRPLDCPPFQQEFPPQAARNLFARLWNDALTSDKVLLLRLMDRRGYIAHPFDFFPEVHWDGLPEAYLPLLEWQRNIATHAAPSRSPTPDNTYSRESAEHTYRRLRAENPDDAQLWLETELNQASAQHRLRLLRDLSSQFAQRDVEILRKLHESDRSGKVKTLALQILRRLGATTELPADLSAFDYIERGTKGLLRRKTKVSAPEKMNSARINLLEQLIAHVGFSDIAAHFSLSERELIDAWDWDASHGVISNALRKSILETGSDDSCHHLMEQFPDALLTLRSLSADEMQRLSGPLCSKAVEVTIAAGSKAGQTFWHIPESFCSWRIENLSEAHSKTLWAKAARHPALAPPKDDKAPELSVFTSQVFKLAMCLQPQDAQLALDYLIERHALHRADPLLAPLHFNIALPYIARDTPRERP